MSDRGITAGMVTEATASTLRPIVLVELNFDVDPFRGWNGTYDLTFDGKTWTGAGDQISVSIEETAAVEARGMTVTLTGKSPDNIGDALGEPIHGRSMKIYIGAMDASDAIVADPILFQGRMDTVEIEENAEVSLITFTGENIHANFRPAARRYTPEDQAIDYVGDDGFEHVAALQDARIPWGSGVR